MDITTANATTFTGVKTTDSASKSTSVHLNYNALFSQIMNGEAGAAESLKEEFKAWENEYMTSGISIDRIHAIQETRDDFMALMEKAVNEGGYDNPQAFLKTLSDEELETLQTMQGLADPINVDALSEEGALNLLLPASAKQDLNNDAIVETGIAKGWQFPPVNAPQSVHDAWDEATEGMTAGEKMLAQGMFLVVMISANVKYNAEGEPVGIYEPGEEGFTNPFAAEDFSYEDTVRKMIEALEDPRRTETADQLERKRTLLQNFLDGLRISDS